MVDILEALLAAMPGILLGWAAIRRAEAMMIRSRNGDRMGKSDSTSTERRG